MAWTDPRTWAVSELVTAAIMNTHIRDNLNALKTPPTATHKVNEGADYTTTSTTFVDVDATDLALTITTTGGDVLIGFSGTVSNTNVATRVYLDVHESVSGARLAGDDGIIFCNIPVAAYNMPLSFTWMATGLAAGVHTFKLQWKTSANTATMWAGAGTSVLDVHPQFWVREI